MAGKKPNPLPTNPKFILDNIDGLRVLPLSEKGDRLIDEIKRLAKRALPLWPDGGGRNEAGNKLKYRCPTCGAVLSSPKFSANYVGDYVCRTCRQRIKWSPGDEY